ncbi:MAG TPA: metal ABC transporter substrate-binding protein [Candidatus Binatia bacterium]
MKWKQTCLWIVLLLPLLNSPLGARTLSVVATTRDLAAIAEAVGGDRVEVRSIAKGSQDPHYVAAKPSYMRLLNRADLLLYNGLQLEAGWLPLLVQGARNPGLVSLNLSQGINVLEVPRGEITRAEGDIHPEGNPHYWLDPRNGLSMGIRISWQLKALSPMDGPFFDQRLEVFKRGLEEGIQSWEGQLRPLRGREVVTYHKQWEYLAHWAGLSIVGYVEDKPGIPPAPKHVAELIRRMQERKIRTLLVTSFVNPQVPQSVAEKAGATMVRLPSSVGGIEGVETYPSLFEIIVSRLVEALK